MSATASSGRYNNPAIVPSREEHGKYYVWCSDTIPEVSSLLPLFWFASAHVPVIAQVLKLTAHRCLGIPSRLYIIVFAKKYLLRTPPTYVFFWWPPKSLVLLSFFIIFSKSSLPPRLPLLLTRPTLATKPARLIRTLISRGYLLRSIHSFCDSLTTLFSAVLGF
ncbi:hypothetical protein F5Y05DRAFT_199619 [Hypoxylon sp. FL0543]|nr:hypothetical protein F5Y05DRAFT_199619 [Hypoxylon sp. FL0543]